MTTDMAYRIMIAAGGTGGHVFPAIAIADALHEMRPSTQITFVGTKDKIEWHAVPKAGYPIRNIWISGFHRRITWQNLLFPIKLITSIIQSIRILGEVKPHLFVSCGGYVAGPAGWVAEKKGIPTVIQEQNSFPGVTNRMLAKKADVIYTAFTQADQWLPSGKTKLIGNPTRKTLVSVERETAMTRLGLDPSRKTLLVLGGSGGAKSINEAMITNLDAIHNELGLQIIWQAGTKYIAALRDRIPANMYPGLIMTDFIYDMPAAYAAADLVVSRAGASSCAELMLTGKPCVLIPSPHVAGNHQMMNAKAMSESGAAVVLADKDASSNLASIVSELITDSDALSNMASSIRALAAPNAAIDIANDIFNRLDTKYPS
jgi:UDP-N-acetylglucosamine--N-acetylmuramyl-(pentapeptide) pyrophosphoryl-undecaprenol N-acetylglucosamine transferase